GLAGETAAQLGVLRGDADRAGVQVALADHRAAERHQRDRAEAVLLRAEGGRDDDVAGRLEAAVDAQPHPPAQVVGDERALRLGQAELPRQAGVLDRRQRARPRAAVVPGHLDVVGVALRDAGRDRADAGARDELHAHARVGVDALEVVDQLGEVLDRVDVVVRRRADQRHARHGAPYRGDLLRDLEAGDLAALARLRALRHLDLDLPGADQVVGRDAEAPGGHLLDGAVRQVAGPRVPARGEAALGHVAPERREARRVLAALPRVAASAEPVHRDRERLVRLARDRAVAHRLRREAREHVGDRLDLVEVERRPGRL